MEIYCATARWSCWSANCVTLFQKASPMPCCRNAETCMTVLIITRSGDNECVDLVAAAIKRKGGNSVRFDTDRFPTETRLIAEYAKTEERLRLVSKEGDLDLRDISSIWHRRLEIGGRIPATLDPQLRIASVEES